MLSVDVSVYRRSIENFKTVNTISHREVSGGAQYPHSRKNTISICTDKALNIFDIYFILMKVLSEV